MTVNTTQSPAHDVLDSRTPKARARNVRGRALALTTGAVLYSAVTARYGFNPGDSADVMITDLAGLTFQAGVLALVSIQLSTRATGLSGKANAMLQVERVLLALAMLWSVLHALLPGQRDALWLGVLDIFWPLSMLGMFFISVKVAFAGRWRGLARYWPLVAESWVVVTLPTMGLLGREVGTVVGAVHLLVGYATLGLILAAKPQLLSQD